MFGYGCLQVVVFPGFHQDNTASIVLFEDTAHRWIVMYIRGVSLNILIAQINQSDKNDT